jgi:hypothetical protein
LHLVCNVEGMAEETSDEGVRNSRQIVRTSRELLAQSRIHIQAAQQALADTAQRLDRARNVLQAAVLRRALRRRDNR